MIEGEVSQLTRLLIGAGFGLVIGSFLATIVSRWPREQSVVKGRSRCDGCGRALNALDLVPLLGWLIARGKCRTCGAKIDSVHPLIEIGAALIGAVCASIFPPVEALIIATFGWLLLTLAVLDARHFWLPDALTLPLAVLGLTVGEWIVMLPPLVDRVVGAFAGASLLFLLAFGYKRLRGKDGLGLGDAKLLGAIGAWLGWQGLPFALLFASVGALIWVGVSRLLGRKVDARTRVPLGTYLCLAVVPAWVTVLALIS